MPSRLVVGSGSVAIALVDAISDSQDPLWVVTDDSRRAETLRGDGVQVVVTERIDRDAITDLDITPETTVVATADPELNVAAATAVRDRFPDAFLLCYAGEEASADQRSKLEATSDSLIAPEEVITGRLDQVLGEDGSRTRQLQQVLHDIDGHLAIVTHDNPDPDAIASAVALGELAERTGCTVTICYYGDISHQENRAFVNLLEYDLLNIESTDTDALETFDGFALVDHSQPGVNDQLPPETPIDIVIDHHPPRLPVDARFVDLRSGVGATSTLLVDYFRRLDVAIPDEIATGLLFGIRVDTKDFRREVSAEDFAAAAELVDGADMDALQRIEDPSVSAETLGVIGRAISNRAVDGSVLRSYVGELSDRDALAQAADQLLNLDGIQATMVYGLMDGTIYASARARGADIDLGEVLRDAFGQIGSAGGHADMAGAQIELGVLESVDDREASLDAVVTSLVDDRFLEAVQSRSHRLLGGLVGPSEYGPRNYPGAGEVELDEG
jgi:nanoRNase/pAp phosphatase (c-di-AMP/oligoRNAs hydrolase)